MDADEALARQLQEEERQISQQQQLAAARLRGVPANRQNIFHVRLQRGIKTVLRYEDETLQALALSVMPDRVLELIPAAAHKEDELATRLLAWFKNDFFTWVNAPACQQCGDKETRSLGAAQPLPEEAQGAARMVEVYSCVKCGHRTRFPRYNDPGKLLETRRGRCGEWANCFTLCCRAAGLDVRYVEDWTDHVWTEYFSHSQGRWIHMDSCENERDKPLLYEVGWGKKLSYCVAFGRHGIADVSRRYTADWPAMSQRRGEVSDAWIQDTCFRMTASLRQGLPPETVRSLAQRDQAEALELFGSQTERGVESLPGRQTGTVEWRAARGELGDGQPPTNQPKSAHTASSSLQPAAQPKSLAGHVGLQSDASSTASIIPTSIERRSADRAATSGTASELADSLSGVALREQKPASSDASRRDAAELSDSLAGAALNEQTPAGSNASERGAGAASASAKAVSSIEAVAKKSANLGGEEAEAAAGKLLSKEQFAQRVRKAFDVIMASGGMTPNEAAVLALKRAREQA